MAYDRTVDQTVLMNEYVAPGRARNPWNRITRRSAGSDISAQPHLDGLPRRERVGATLALHWHGPRLHFGFLEAVETWRLRWAKQEQRRWEQQY
jgi:hypothetical protein